MKTDKLSPAAPPPPRARLDNRLIASLPAEEREALLSRITPVDLSFGQIIYEPFERITEVYFPLDALISLLSVTAAGSTIETGMVGNEGLMGAVALLGKETTPYRALVQDAGVALKVGLVEMESLCARHPALRSLIFRYLHGLMTQLSQSAVCNRFHTTDQRLARWLLISQDRVQSEVFSWTQEFLAYMLGSDRVSVTHAVRALKKAGIIGHSRGQVTILDRGKLEQGACECYKFVKNEFDEFLPAF